MPTKQKYLKKYIYTKNMCYVNTIFISNWIGEGIWVLSEKAEFLQSNFNSISA